MATATASDVYANQLFRLGYGFPLWDPQSPRGEVFVGDVGFIADGSFHRVFNATSPEDDPANKYGVPSEYKPFTLTSEFSSYTKLGALAPGALCSRTIKQLSVGMAASSHGVGAGLEFQCTDNQGAVLVMPHGANRERILPSRRMVHYMSQNFASWHEFITNRLDVDVPKESIQFISGVYKVSRWAVASYVEAGKSARFQFNADLGAASTAFSASAATQIYSAPVQNWGPRCNSASTSAADQNVRNDQSVFIHYYKLKRRLLVFPPRVMRAAAGDDELPPGPDDDPGDSCVPVDAASSIEVNEFEPDQSTFQNWDPVDLVLDYILEHEADCQVAVAHDRDINQLCEQHGCEIPEDIALFLETVKPHIEVTEDGLGMLSHDEITALKPTPGVEQSVPSYVANEASASSSSSASEVPSAERKVPQTSDAHDVPNGGDENNDSGDPPGQNKARYLGPNGGVIELEHQASSFASLAYSPDGRYVASGADDALLVIWDATDGRCLHTCQHHSDAVCSLAFSPDSRTLLSGGADSLAVIWDVETAQVMKVLAGHTGTVYCVAYSPDGSTIATGSVDTSVRLWDAASGRERFVLSGHSAIVLIVAFSHDNRRLVSASADYSTRVWSVEDGTQLSVLEGHQGVIYALAYAPDNRRLVTGSDDGSARIWNAETGEELVDLRVHSGSVWSVAFSADGTRLLSAASDGSIRICDSYSGERLHELDAGDQFVNATAFSADGSRMCASAADNSIRVWDAAAATLLATLVGHSDKVSQLRFSPDATCILSSSDDGLLRIWDLGRLGVGQEGTELVEV